MHGQVKWFDPAKGFGFVVSDESQSDILLHANVLRNFGQGSIADGSGITVKVQQTQRGVQAVEVLAIEPPAVLEPPPPATGDAPACCTTCGWPPPGATPRICPNCGFDGWTPRT